jgi:photosystem II stability/assembly factor-like uncharacterized protein
MSKGRTLAALTGFIGLLALPPVASGTAITRACWLRDAVSPTPSIVYAMCEQGRLYVTRDAGATWTSIETGAAASGTKATTSGTGAATSGTGAATSGTGTATSGTKATTSGAGAATSGTGTATSGTGAATGGTGADTSEAEVQVSLRSLTFIDATHGLIVGDRGTILASDDGGKTWQPRKSGTTNHLLTVVSVGNNVWAGGYDGILLHSSDAGRTWQPQKTPSGLAIESIYFLDAVHGWAVGWAGTILRTADGGNNWEAIKTSAASWSLSGVYFKDLKVGWVVGFQGQLMRSDDGGSTWKAQSPKDAKGEPIRVWLKGITADSSNRIWVAADDQLLMSADGQTWTAKPTADLLFLRDFVHVGNSLWAIGQLGALKLQDPGTTWKSVDTLVVGGSTKDVVGSEEKPASSQ